MERCCWCLAVGELKDFLSSVGVGQGRFRAARGANYCRVNRANPDYLFLTLALALAQMGSAAFVDQLGTMQAFAVPMLTMGPRCSRGVDVLKYEPSSISRLRG